MEYGKYRVLVIDDDPDLAQYTRALLERKAGCTVITQSDAVLALTAVDEFRPDVVVTDVEMPGMSGLELLGHLRSDHPGLPVIVMTGTGSLDYAMSALRQHADDFFTKPIPSAQLVASVNRLAAQRRTSGEKEKELDRAAEVQQGLLPAELAGLDGYALVGGCVPTRAVGGDFYDWYETAGGVTFTLADVMGKGVGAAIIAATVRAVLRSSADLDLAVAISAAASALEADLSRAGTFVTAFHAHLDVESGDVRYIDAGHGLSMLVRAGGGVKRLATTSYPLGTGLDGGWREHRVSLEPGDTLVSVSDGVLDLWDGTLASLQEVERITRAASSAEEIVSELRAITSTGAEDDVTVVALRRF